MKIKFCEKNYYFKEQNTNTRMSYLFQELLLTTLTCCLTSATEGKMCLWQSS